MKIFTKIKDSIYNPEYYKEILQKPFSYSIKYFLFFALIFALVFAIPVSLKLIDGIKNLSENSPQLANYFPEELTIFIKDGKASTNVQEPYFIKIPSQWKAGQDIDIQGENIENIVVIDTKSSITAETFNLYNTFVLLGKDSIAYMDNGKISMVPLAEFDNLVINRGIILDIINNIKPFFSYLYPLAILGAFIFGYMVVVGKIFYLIFGALLIWLVIKMMGTNIGYKKSYQIGLHLITLPIIIVSVLNFIPFRITFVFLFSIILVLSTVLNFRNNNISIIEKNTAI